MTSLTSTEVRSARVTLEKSDEVAAPALKTHFALAHKEKYFIAYVTTFGALWGAMEITLGTFFHTLRFPFAGVLLSAMGVAVLVGQRQLMPFRGITLATGIVAALCKSLSPGGIILGPMIGIITAALIIEIALFARSRSLVFAMLGGSVVALWAAFQQLLTHYVLYGRRLLEIYLAALRKAIDYLGFSEQEGVWALVIFISIIVLLGAIGGFLGRRIGHQAKLIIDESLISRGAHHEL